MGRGSYTGGHTVIGPWSSGWFSNGRRTTSPSVSSKRKNKTKKSPSLNGIKGQFLHQVISAELKGENAPIIPKSFRAELFKEVAQAGDSFRWAKQQPLYVRLRKKKSAKMARNGNSPIAGNPRSATNISELRKKRMKLEMAMAEAKDIVTACEAEIREIDAVIDQLSAGSRGKDAEVRETDDGGYPSSS